MRGSRSRVLIGLLWLGTGCGAGDTLPGRATDALAVRPDDGLLRTEALQAVTESALERDGAALRAAFESSDPAVRARAAFSMASVRALGAAPELRVLLGDPDPRVRADAAFALAHYSGAGDAGDQFVDLLSRETDPMVRDAVIDALGKAGYSRSLGLLLELDGRDRAAATLALARSVLRGSPPASAMDTLVARLNDPDPLVRRNAAYFVERIQDPGAWIDFRGPVRSALDAMAVDDPAALSLVAGLGGRFDVFSLPRIIYRAHNASDWRVRANAMVALNGMGDGEDRLRALLDGMNDPSPHVRALAAATLATSPPGDDVQAWLLAWLDEHPDDVAAVGPVLALLAQAGRGEPLFDWVRGLALNDEARWAVALAALAEAGGAETLAALLRATTSPQPRISRPAASALVERIEATEGPSAIPTALEHLSQAVRRSDPVVVGSLAVVLAGPRFGPAGGIDRLAEVWGVAGPSDPQRREAIVSALRGAGATAALARLGVAPEPVGGVGDEVSAPTGPEISLPDPSSAFDDRGVPNVDWAALATLGSRPELVLETDEGTVVIRLAADQAPLTVYRLGTLASAGHFDGLPFHRVVPNFVVQTGDLGRAPGPRPRGGPMRTEVTRIAFDRGVVGMANTGALDTESTQFFITHDRKPHLDGGYTSFGWVVDGMEVVDRIQSHHTIRRASVRAGR